MTRLLLSHSLGARRWVGTDTGCLRRWRSLRSALEVDRIQAGDPCGRIRIRCGARDRGDDRSGGEDKK